MRGLEGWDPFLWDVLCNLWVSHPVSQATPSVVSVTSHSFSIQMLEELQQNHHQEV